MNDFLTGAHEGRPYIICGHFDFSNGQLRAENFQPLHLDNEKTPKTQRSNHRSQALGQNPPN
jgi:hypothetical protein